MQPTTITVQTFDLANLPPLVKLFKHPKDIIPAFERGECLIGLINLREQMEHFRPDWSDNLKNDFNNNVEALIEQMPDAHNFELEDVNCPAPKTFFHRDGYDLCDPKTHMIVTGIFKPCNTTFVYTTFDKKMYDNIHPYYCYDDKTDGLFNRYPNHFRRVNSGYGIFMLGSIVSHSIAARKSIGGRPITLDNEYTDMAETPVFGFGWIIKRPPNLRCPAG